MTPRERTEARNRAMRELYEQWRAAEAHLHPYSPERRGLGALAAVFGVSIHIARHAVAYAR